MLMIVLIGVFGVAIIDYCACRLSSQISHEEEKLDLYSKIQNM